MGRVGAGENNQTPNPGNDGLHQNEQQTRSTNIHTQLHHQQEEAFPPYQESSVQESYVYVHHDEQPAAFPPPPDKAHAFPPPQEPTHHQTPASFPPNQPLPQFNQHPMHMHGGMGIPINMPAASPYNNPVFQPTIPTMGTNPSMTNPNMIGINMEPWRSTLFDCFDDAENALITACFPCVTFGQIAEIVDQGQSSCATSGCLYTLISCFTAMPCLLTCSYRSKLRNRFMLVEAPGSDCVIHCFCHWCALCQEYRELKLRGYDPAIGWLGNAANMGRMNAGSIAMTPPIQPTMMGR